MKAIIIGTGPSIDERTVTEVERLKLKGYKLFGCNLAYTKFDLDVFHACNPEFYHYYWDKGLDAIEADKFTWDRDTALRYDIYHVSGKWAKGLSTNKGYIHYHHGSGPQLINIALHYGAKEMLLVGWDMRYPDKVSDKEYRSKRHFFGEYPKELQHWPKTGQDGSFTGLIKEMETIIPSDYGINIYNCTKGSSLKCFEFRNLEDF